jgi:beta-lactamase class A
MNQRRAQLLFIVTIAGISGIVFFLTGWFLSGIWNQPPLAKSLRIGGYQFIDPLLACNINNSNTFLQDHSLGNQISSIINTNVQAGNLSKASAYFVNLSSGNWTSVNPTETFYPSSLGKIPIMIAYYEMAETNPDILNKAIVYPIGGTDLNTTQDIAPPQAIVPGQAYTVEQLIEYMVKYSDNNAAELLYNNIDQTALQNVYGDLGIPVDNDPNITNLDFITPQEISLLFRVLYNGTYLSRDYSEKALELMSQSSFTQGIVAGLPSSTVVSHKLGLVGIQTNGVTTEHELHDCGIVYANDPYLLCIMTRGSSSLSTIENIIANISQAAYNNVASSH